MIPQTPTNTALFAPHNKIIPVAIMLQSFDIDGSIKQPIPPIALKGDSYALPSRLVEGLVFMSPFRGQTFFGYKAGMLLIGDL